jgi:DNA-directed RNA polymerase subunit E'/Rpb7
MSVFEIVDTVVKIAVLPHELGDITSTIRKKLNAMLFSYSIQLEAVPIMYTDLSFENDALVGRVMAEQPWIHVDVRAKIMQFNPVPGRVVQGKVKTVSDSHISILAYGMFNASIAGEKLSESFKYNEESNMWEPLKTTKGGNTAANIEEGSVVNFTAVNCQFSHGVFFVEGSLV